MVNLSPVPREDDPAGLVWQTQQPLITSTWPS